MEYLKSFLSDLQARFRNPLISAFIISWLVFNWKISLLCIHFFTDSNSKLNFEEFISKINLLSNTWISIIFPLATAVFYITLFPFIQIGIGFLQAWFTRQRTVYELKGSKDGSVSIDKYMVLREDYKTKISELEVVIKGESVQIEQNQILSNNLRDKNSEHEKLLYDMSLLKKRRASYILNGYWEINFNNKSPEEDVLSQINLIEIIADTFTCYPKNSNEVRYKGVIMIYDFDEINHKILLLLKIQEDKGEFISKIKNLVFELIESKNFYLLSGTLNTNHQIIMRRILQPNQPEDSTSNK